MATHKSSKRVRVAFAIQQGIYPVTPMDVEEFEKMFSRKFTEFFDPVYGFDVIHFDKSLGVPDDGISTSEFLANEFGADAVKLITTLVTMRPVRGPSALHDPMYWHYPS